MKARTAIGCACDVWAELVCPLALHAFESDEFGTSRREMLAFWRRLHHLDTIMAAAGLELMERRCGAYAPFLLRDFIPLMRCGWRHDSTMALVRRCFVALAQFGLVRIEGRPRRVRLGRTDDPCWRVGVRQVGELLVDAFEAWSGACGSALEGAPIRESDTAYCFSLMVDAGFAPGQSIRQSDVLNDVVDRDRELSERFEVERKIVRRAVDSRAHVRVILARCRTVLSDDGVLIVKRLGVSDARLTLTARGKRFHAAMFPGTVERVRSQAAVAAMRQASMSVGADRMSLDDIDAEIDSARSERIR